MSPTSRYPRLCRDLTMVPDGGTLLLSGGPRRHRLTGPGTGSALPRLLPLLDGRHDVTAIAAAAGLPDTAVRRLLTALNDCDMLEWLPGTSGASGAAADLPGHAESYFSRTIATLPSVTCTEELAGVLVGAAVLLVCSDPAAVSITEDLAGTGVPGARLRPTPAEVTSLDLAWLTRADRGLAAVFDDDATALAETVRLLRGTGIPVLRFCGDSITTQIGPVFLDDWTACVCCFRSVHPRLTGTRVSGVTAALTAASILASLTGTGTTGRPWRMTRLDSRDWQSEALDVTPEAGCPGGPHAGPPAATDTEGALVFAYEWQHEKRPAILTAPANPTREQAQRLIALSAERDPYPPAPARELTGEIGPELAVLADILARTAGYREPLPAKSRIERWAPSGGNLGSVQLYILAEGDIFGLPGTLFRYDDVEHRVLPVRADRIPLDAVLPGACRAAEADERAAVLVIFVASVGRLARKYDEFALRLAHLDAGCAALQFAATAVGRNAAVSFAYAWHPGLDDLLELDPEDEVVTAVAVLHRLSEEGHGHGTASSG
jgi:SagB-type dehydrogenase family enzyme